METAPSTAPAPPWYRIPAPEVPVAGWHVSPLVDAAAYHWSWVWVLVPVVLIGGPEASWWPMMIFVLGLNFSHRLLTLPYVYFDRAVFRTHPWRFTVFPLLMVGCIAASPWVERTGPAGRLALGVCAGVSAVWNLWHVMMQKYGILRMYAAKSGLPPAARAPGWVDRLLVFAPLPLLIAWVGPENRAAVATYFRSGRSFMPAVIDGLVAFRPVLLAAGIALCLAAVFLFVRAEWRSHRLTHRPRLSMALGTTLLAASFLVVDPVKAYLAYGFSHAVEYFVFVWAFLRKRYRAPLAHDPLLGRVLRRPALFYGLMLLGLGAFYAIAKWWDTYFYPGEKAPVWLGVPSYRWMFYLAVFQSMTHFYFDGFLWKMRVPETRANL